MEVEWQKLRGLALIKLAVHQDERGFFVERFNFAEFTNWKLPLGFVQDNHSRSKPGVIRGLHYQHGQGKLVGVARGRVWDVVVDIETHSPSFGKWQGFELAEDRLLWIPPGFAHGFCVLGDEPADLFYKVDDFWKPGREQGIRWNDPSLGIRWPIANPVLSQRDRELPLLKNR